MKIRGTSPPCACHQSTVGTPAGRRRFLLRPDAAVVVQQEEPRGLAFNMDGLLAKMDAKKAEAEKVKSISIRRLDGTTEERSLVQPDVGTGAPQTEEEELAAALAMSMAPDSAAHEQARTEAQQDQIAMFVGMTGADVGAARTMLEASAWNMDAAVNAFFEHGGPTPSSTGASTPVAAVPSQTEPEPEPSAGPEPAPGPGSVSDGSVMGDIMNMAKERKPDEAAEGRSFAGSGFSMKEDGLRQRRPGGVAREEVPPRTVTIVFYADGFTVDDAPAVGGSRIVGGEMVTPAKKKGVAGFGRVLDKPKLPPLRPYNVPANDKFLKQVKANQLPPELQDTTKDTGLPIPVSIALSDRRPQTYPKPEDGGATHTAFAGSGQTLGGTRPTAKDSAPARAQAAAGGSDGTPVLGLAWIAHLWGEFWRRVWGLASLFRFGGRDVQAVRALPVVDVDRPTTQVRLRFSDDGSVVTLTLNEDMTVEDLYSLAGEELRKKEQQQQPQPSETEPGDEQVAEPAWELAGGFPPKPIPRTTRDDGGDSQAQKSLKELGLLNSSVTQRYLVAS